MNASAVAQQALTEVRQLRAELAEFKLRTGLSFDILGLDQACADCVAVLDELERHGGNPWSWEQQQCLERYGSPHP